MRVITRKNNTGKTKELIKKSLEEDIPILALSVKEKESLQEKAISYFDRMVKVVLPDDLEKDMDVLVDDLDKVCIKLMQSLFLCTSFNIVGATITEE